MIESAIGGRVPALLLVLGASGVASMRAERPYQREGWAGQVTVGDLQKVSRRGK